MQDALTDRNLSPSGGQPPVVLPVPAMAAQLKKVLLLRST